MAQHDYVIDNQSFPATRTDINNVLLAISSTNSGATAPSTTYASQLWYDTSENKLYIRNEDNDAWIPLFLLDQSNDVAGTLATEIDVEDASGTDTAGTSLTIKGGAGTGTGAGGSIVFQTADGAGSTGSSVNAHATQVTITDDGKVGIGITAPEALTHIAGATADADGALGSMSPQLIIEGGNNNNPFELGMDNSGATAIAFLQSRNKSAGAQTLALNPAGGNVVVGTTDSNPVVNNVAGALFSGSTGAGQFSRTDNAALFLNRGNNGTIQQFYRAGSAVGSISVTASATSYNTSSDYRLKENVADLTGAIDRVKTLSPKRFNFIADPDTTVDGFLAHEVTAVPEAIVGTHNQVDDDGNPVYQGIDQSKLVPLLTAALQEAIAKIEALETRVAALEG